MVLRLVPTGWRFLISEVPLQAKGKGILNGVKDGTATERAWNNLHCVKDFRTKHGSSQGQNMALTS